MYLDLEVPLHLLDWNYVSANPDKIEWLHLSGNPNAIHLLESNLEKVYDWTLLSGNPNAIHLLEANLDKVEWDDFYSNPCSIPLLNVEFKHWGAAYHTIWEGLSSNPKAFGYDYEAMKASRALLAEDLTNAFFHPDNISKFRRLGLELSERWGI